jgi:hypothetical protein
VAGSVLGPGAALHERDELVADVDERSTLRAPKQGELEQLAEEGTRFLDIADLKPRG